MIPPRWHADGCWVCNSCGSRRARWNREDGPEHHNRDCAYSLATFADRPLADAPRVAAVTPAADVSRDPAAPEKHGGGGSSWAADVEAEWRAERAAERAATLAAVADDDKANARRFERMTRPENFNGGVRVHGDPYSDVRPWLRVAR